MKKKRVSKNTITMVVRDGIIPHIQNNYDIQI